MKSMRTNNSIRNIITSLIGQIISILVTFISRIIFIRILGENYLGINGLFTNILSLLSLAEMGFGSAIVYSLYKPLAKNEQAQIGALVGFYSKIYSIIGLVTLFPGLLIMPFINYFIKDNSNIPNLSIIYLLYLLNTVTTYFFAHKRSLLIADQKSYIVTIYKYGFFIALNIIQIIVLILTTSYIHYLILQVISSFVENYIISISVNKIYPFIRKGIKVELEKEEKRLIFRNARAMFYHRIGTVVVNSTDSILISAFVGIVWVGKYSNYLLVITALNSIIGHIFSSLTASVGNLNVLNREKSFNVFKAVLLANFWIIAFCSIAFKILINPFIILWLGDEFLLNDSITLVIALNFYLSGMRKAVLMYRDSLGLFWNDRYKPIFESVINLVASLVLVNLFGMIGVLIGTSISTLATCFWVEPYILYKHGFGRSTKEYYIKYLIYAIIFAVTYYITNIACIHFDFSIKSSIIRLLICIIIPNIIFTIIFHRTNEFKFLYNKIKDYIEGFINKSKLCKKSNC